MARVKIEITCKECGKTFTHFHTCRNTTEAASYEAWALKHITTCRECDIRLAEEADKNKKEAMEEKLNLPELSGSEKQINWARTIRFDILKEIPDEKMNFMKKSISGLTESDFNEAQLEQLGKMNLTMEQFAEQLRKRNKKAFIMLTSDSAKEIIDNR